MFKITTFMFTLVLVMNSAIAKPNSILDYEVLSKSTTRSVERAYFESASAPIKKGWFKYKVELNMPRSYTDDETGEIKHWTSKVNVWFWSHGEAKAFSAVMNSHRATDIYYNFSKSKYNSQSTSTGCAIAIPGLFCKDFPVTYIDFHNIEASDAYAFDPASGQTVPLMDYVDDHYADGKVSLD